MRPEPIRPRPIDDVAVTHYQQAIAANLPGIQERIRSAARGRAVELVAVTKGHPIEAVVACVRSGLTHLGENYADELVSKAADPASDGARWSYLGLLQTNKMARLVDHVDLWQTIDSVSHATALAKRAPSARVLIQMNLVGKTSRVGCDPSDAESVLEAARTAGLVVSGVMGVGPDPAEVGWTTAASTAAFQSAATFAVDRDLPIRSLGMSADLEFAVEAGANMVRVGTALLGPRVARNPDDFAEGHRSLRLAK